MNLFDRAVAAISPGTALSRARSRAALNALMHYDAASTGQRTRSLSPNSLDADGAAARRARLANVARDMVRNTSFALRAQQVIVGNVVGDGIIPSFQGSDAAKRRGMALVKAHMDTTSIDAAGRSNLYGLQRLVMNAVTESGEALVRRRWRREGDNLPLPFQLQVIEADYLDTMKTGSVAGGYIQDGIEYDQIGRRAAYWLFSEHPGATKGVFRRSTFQSHRVPAMDIAHIYRQDRPGQMRGVSWLAPVAMALQDLHDHQDAQLVRQKIAACFAVFRYSPNGDAEATEATSSSIMPGAIQQIPAGEDIKLAVPPGVDGFDEFSRVVLRSVAAGLGITYESLVGDLSNVNYSSARMGRIEMDRNVSTWQWLLLIPQMMGPVGQWFMEAWRLHDGRIPAGTVVEWTPPRRTLVDPGKEMKAIRDSVRAGFMSRSRAVRELGFDPEEINAEIANDNAEAKRLGLLLDTEIQPPPDKMESK